MSTPNSILLTTKSELCTGCGVCEDVCNKHCILIKQSNDTFRPIVNEAECSNCGRCLKVCPGVGINFEKHTETSPVLFDKYIGYYNTLYTGYTLDNDIRFHSASGGMVSQLLIYLLEKKIIDGAVVTGFGNDNITPHSYIARNKEDVIAARSSKYCPVSLNKVGNEIANSDGKFVIVGLPCHIQGFRKRMAIDKRFKEHVFGLFAIYCSSGRTFGARDFLLKHYKIEKTNIDYFAFRDNGCLGNLTIKEHPTDIGRKELQIPYVQYYGRILRSFFKTHRCLSCIDHYGQLADISFGDIHIPPYSDDKIGISSVVVRSKFWDNILRKAVTEGYCHVDRLDSETLNKSQSDMLYPKMSRAKATMQLNSLLLKRNPVYDIDFSKVKCSIKDYLHIISTRMQIFVGRHRWLWFLIEWLSNINNNKNE